MFEYFRYTPRWLWKTLLRGKTDKYRQLIDGYLAIVEKVVLGTPRAMTKCI